MLVGENFGKFSYLDYLGEKTLVNSLFQINTEIKGSIKLREKTLAIGHQFANVFCYTVTRILDINIFASMCSMYLEQVSIASM